MARRLPSTERAVDRLINFSDAVVAVAITVLALPLVDIAGPSQGETVWSILNDHSDELTAFFFTFFVVAVMWITHNRILNSIEDYDGFLFWMNAFWLVLIVLMPWFSSMYGQAISGGRGVGLLYWCTLAAISFLASAMSWHLRRHPQLLSPEGAESRGTDTRLANLRGPIFGLYFLLVGISTIIVPGLANWMAYGIIVLSLLLRTADSQPDTAISR